MIPYEDLVYALTEWRARKGLPTVSSAPAPRVTAPAARPAPPAPSAPAQPAYAAPAQPAYAAPAQPAYAAPAQPAYAAPAQPAYAAPAQPAYAAPVQPAGYPGAHGTQAAFGGSPGSGTVQMMAAVPAPGTPNFAAVQAAFAGGAGMDPGYDHQVSEEDEVISLGAEDSASDAMSFERPGTQPGFAPNPTGVRPGARR